MIPFALVAVALVAFAPPLRAAEAAPDTTGLAGFLAMVNRPVVLRVPGTDRVRVIEDLAYRTVTGVDLSADVYASQRPGPRTAPLRPIVILLHGGVGPELVPRPKDWGSYRSWGRLLAASGWVAVTFNQRLGYPEPEIENALADVESLVTFVRARAKGWGGDPDRVAFVSYSAGGMLLAPAIRHRPAWLRCIVAMYPIIDLRGSAHLRRYLRPEQLEEYSAGSHLAQSAATMAPLMIVRAGRDQIPDLLAGVDRFVQEALAADAPVVLVNHRQAAHGFDNDEATPRTLNVLRWVLDFLAENLRSGADATPAPSG
jgi:acetyl esterase/lipase